MKRISTTVLVFLAMSGLLGSACSGAGDLTGGGKKKSAEKESTSSESEDVPPDSPAMVSGAFLTCETPADTKACSSDEACFDCSLLSGGKPVDVSGMKKVEWKVDTPSGEVPVQVSFPETAFYRAVGKVKKDAIADGATVRMDITTSQGVVKKTAQFPGTATSSVQFGNSPADSPQTAAPEAPATANLAINIEHQMGDTDDSLGLESASNNGCDAFFGWAGPNDSFMKAITVACASTVPAAERVTNIRVQGVCGVHSMTEQDKMAVETAAGAAVGSTAELHDGDPDFSFNLDSGKYNIKFIADPTTLMSRDNYWVRSVLINSPCSVTAD